MHARTAIRLAVASTVLTASAARAAEPTASLSLERVVNASLISGGSTASSVIGIGGPAYTVYSHPLLAVDYLSPAGVTAGAGIAFTRLAGKTSGITNLMLEPRLGYRVTMRPGFELVPRLALPLGRTILSSDDSASDSTRWWISAALSAVGVARLGAHFNLLTAFTADRVLATSSSSAGGDDPSILSVHAWMGIGGYF